MDLTIWLWGRNDESCVLSTVVPPGSLASRDRVLSCARGRFPVSQVQSSEELTALVTDFRYGLQGDGHA